MKLPIPVVDLFAGPGGLSEGLSSVEVDGSRPFQIALSVEKDRYAFRTLRLRAFCRQFPKGEIPSEYYKYVQSGDNQELESLLNNYPDESARAAAETIQFEIGNGDQAEFHNRVRQSLGRRKHCVLIGGPPCQAYSVVGRSRNKGIEGYTPEGDDRHFLYKHYLEILSMLQPVAFVMENVPGILTSKINGELIFQNILRDLSNPASATGSRKKLNYELVALTRTRDGLFPAANSYVIQSERFGIPQRRHRVIILGIRSDLHKKAKSEYHLTERDEVPASKVLTLPKLRSGLSRNAVFPDSWEHWLLVVTSTETQDWFSAIENSVQMEIRNHIEDLNSLDRQLKREATSKGQRPSTHVAWFTDRKLYRSLNHRTRNHRDDDLHRYMFASAYARVHGRSPTLRDYPEELLPAHSNAHNPPNGEKIFGDRFRVQLADRPATTVVSHIAKDGHYYIHPDPMQCRSLTVREAARLQTFPDNYYFCGPMTEQYRQVGNAVPPYLAKQIGEVLYQYLEDIL